MKYFIDFEFYNSPVYRISSVGCIDENGQEFYSLVRQSDSEIDDNYCKTRMISRLGFLSAPSINDVFVKLYRWINHNDNVEFYCYGGADYTFIDFALKEKISFEANCMLCFLIQNMIDYSVSASRFFHTKSKIALIKIINYIRGYEVKQLHNALDDAKFLKEVFEYTQKNEPLKAFPFAEYETSDTICDVTKSLSCIVATSSNKTYSFDNLINAALFFTGHCKPNVTNEHYCEIVESTVERIKTAIKNHTKFMGLFWQLEQKN